MEDLLYPHHTHGCVATEGAANDGEIGILGVSKAQINPVWVDSEFVPRLMLPLSLSYDHRLINGGNAGKFLTSIVRLLSDVRTMIL